MDDDDITPEEEEAEIQFFEEEEYRLGMMFPGDESEPTLAEMEAENRLGGDGDNGLPF